MPRQAKKQTRRANNEGTVYKRPDGTWCCQVTVGYHPETGRPVRKTFYGKTQSEVVSKKTAVLQQLKDGQSFMPEADCLANDFIRNWLMTYKRLTVTPSTFEWYCSLTKIHIYPAFDSIKLRDIHADQIQNLLIQCVETKKLSRRTARGVQLILNQVLEHAVRQGLIRSNPVKLTTLPQTDSPNNPSSKAAFSVELRQQLLEASESNPTIRPIVVTLMFTGMRIGELLALNWADINFDGRTITVSKALKKSPRMDESGKCISREVVIGAPKTRAGNRTIAVPLIVTTELQKWKTYVTGINPAYGDEESPVFINNKGVRRTYDNFKTIYRRFLERHSLDGQHLTAHRYRHTLATMLLEQKENPRTVQGVLGHQDVQTTLGIYSHVTKEVYQDVANTLEEVYESTRSGEYRPRKSVEKPHDDKDSHA